MDISEINISNLKKQTPLNLEPESNRGTGIPPEVEANLFKFKQVFIGLIKEDYNQVVITNKTEETEENTPYYQIIIGKKNVLIKDVIGNIVQRNILYIWNTLSVTVDGTPGELSILETYFQQMVLDMDNDHVEIFYV